MRELAHSEGNLFRAYRSERSRYVAGNEQRQAEAEAAVPDAKFYEFSGSISRRSHDPYPRWSLLHPSFSFSLHPTIYRGQAEFHS